MVAMDVRYSSRSKYVASLSLSDKVLNLLSYVHYSKIIALDLSISSSSSCCDISLAAIPQMVGDVKTCLSPVSSTAVTLLLNLAK